MPNVRCDLEFDYDLRGMPLPANDVVEIEYFAPEGFALISWGHSGPADPGVRIINATISPAAEGQLGRFIGRVQNDSAADTSMRWTFVLLKL